jgi:uncharacterized membrane protein YedE/YeeE
MIVGTVASLVVGLIIGYLGQRSRMCFVAAVRDYLLIKDTEKLKGLIAFLLIGWIAFPLVTLFGGPPMTVTATTASALVLVVIGGLGVGLISTLANGCPFRQHVLAAQGAVNAMIYLVGFLVGALLFDRAVAPLLVRLLG